MQAELEVYSFRVSSELPIETARQSIIHPWIRL